MVNEVFADGLGSVRIVGDVIQLNFVSAKGEDFEPRVRLLLPHGSLDALIATLTKARRGLQTAGTD